MNERLSPVRDRAVCTRHRPRYSEICARRIMQAYAAEQMIDDVVTISTLARRTGENRDTVRAVLRYECGWTEFQSRRAHEEGVRRGHLLLAMTEHPGLAKGRATQRLQGWPHLRRAQEAAKAMGYPALRRGRATQAAQGWPGLSASHATQAASGYPSLQKARANLAARGWPNCKNMHAILLAQDYLPVAEARLRRALDGPQVPDDDRRLRARSTRMAIIDTLRELQHRLPAHTDTDKDGAPPPERKRRYPFRVTIGAVAACLHLHSNTVAKYLRQLRAEGIIDHHNILLHAVRHEA